VSGEAAPCSGVSAGLGAAEAPQGLMEKQLSGRGRDRAR
jgi:hypothetical protein